MELVILSATNKVRPTSTETGFVSVCGSLRPPPPELIPPPPPNQIVLVHYAPGLAIEDIYQPLWVEGRLRIESSSNALADAAYSLQASQLRLVEEDDL